MGGHKKYDVYIAYRQGVRKDETGENIPLITPVFEALSRAGYKVFFNYGDDEKKKETNDDQNLEYIDTAPVILVFLDKSVKDMKEGDGFDKEIKRIRQRISQIGSSKGILVYRYNGYTHECRVLDLSKSTYLEEKTELKRSAQLVVRDVERELHNYHSPSYKCLKRTKIIVSLAFVVLAGIALFACVNMAKNKAVADTAKEDYRLLVESGESRLVIAGGSTVKNFLEATEDGFIDNYSNSIYIHMGSEEAWGLLMEDIMATDSGRRYYPIVLSAGKIDSASIRVRTGYVDDVSFGDFKSRRNIEELKCGETNLIVQLYPKNNFKDYCKKKKITISELGKLLKEKNNTILTTSNQSGTLSAYKGYLPDSSLFKNTTIFNPNTYRDINGKEIILTNEQYKYSKDPGNTIDLLLVDDHGLQCKLDLYIYSIVTRVNNGTDYSRPVPVNRFLERVRDLNCFHNTFKGTYLF